MLRKRGIPSTLYLGVKITEANAMTAHAWTRAGTKWVTGNNARRGQTTVACFAQLSNQPRSISTSIRMIFGISVGLIITILSLMPNPPLWDLTWRTRPRWLREPIHIIGSHDFALNLVGFLIAGLIYNSALFGSHRASIRYRWLSALLFCSFTCTLECLQLLLPGRNFDPMDMIAGCLGITLATLFWTKPNWNR